MASDSGWDAVRGIDGCNLWKTIRLHIYIYKYMRVWKCAHAPTMNHSNRLRSKQQDASELHRREGQTSKHCHIPCNASNATSIHVEGGTRTATQIHELHRARAIDLLARGHSFSSGGQARRRIAQLPDTGKKRYFKHLWGSLLVGLFFWPSFF